jgi:hypothetical protein
MSDSLSELCPIDAVVIAEEIPWCFIPGERLHDLLGSPLGGRVLGDVEVHDVPPLMGQDDEHKEDPKRDGRHGKEIERYQVLNVVLEERLPGW